MVMPNNICATFMYGAAMKLWELKTGDAYGREEMHHHQKYWGILPLILVRAFPSTNIYI